MSRIGNQPITIPSQVALSISGNTITLKGPKGELSQIVHPKISLAQESDILKVIRFDDDKPTRALHGLTRSLIANMVTGVTVGYQKRLELIGTGYRVAKQGDTLVFNLGFSHPVEIKPRPGINFEVEGNTKITVSGIDKQLVGQTAAEIRHIKPPEPYKGKGIRYEGEVVRHKAGKAAKVGAAA